LFGGGLEPKQFVSAPDALQSQLWLQLLFVNMPVLREKFNGFV
jgi:hypothetical protein